jgi:hypothetical protein
MLKRLSFYFPHKLTYTVVMYDENESHLACSQNFPPFRSRSSFTNTNIVNEWRVMLLSLSPRLMYTTNALSQLDESTH